MKKEKTETKKKTYCVNGLMEWQLDLYTGTKKLPYITVNFTGGQITGYGISPARFATADPGIQSLIEATRWFKTGKIYLSRR